MLDPLVHRAIEVLAQQGAVVPVVVGARGEHELLAEQVEERPQRRHGRRDDAPLDARDGGLACTRALRQLPLGYAAASAGTSQELTCDHPPKGEHRF